MVLRGLTVAEVIDQGILNLAMGPAGQAFALVVYLNRLDRGGYLAAERQAQRLGVYAVPGG